MRYIDAEKLIAEIDSILSACTEQTHTGVFNTCTHIKGLITSLQQEQPDNEDIDKVAQELYEHLYELKRRNNVQTNLYDKKEIIDLWKAGIEYGRNHPNKEQSEVDLEKAALHVYESWMGGTMDDVIRDMVELGKVLNARKK